MSLLNLKVVVVCVLLNRLLQLCVCNFVPVCDQLYRQDCITFGTVVNMLVTKEPRLDQLLQAPLHKSLIEIKERCLEDLRHFIKDLDQVASKLGTP